MVVRLSSALIALLCLFAQIPSAFAVTPLETPAGYVLQGRLTDSNGNPITASNLTLVIDVYSPDGTCLLYEESQTGIDLSQTGGNFALIFGSDIGDPKRTMNDPGLALPQIFANVATQLRAPSASCPTGYTPAPGDERGVRLAVVDGAPPVILAPDQAIAAVPYATVAETLQGMPPSAFLPAVSGTAQLTKYSAAPFSCSTAHDGQVALTHLYTMCVCNGGSAAWVQTSNGTSSCSW